MLITTVGSPTPRATATAATSPPLNKFPSMPLEIRPFDMIVDTPVAPCAFCSIKPSEVTVGLEAVVDASIDAGPSL